MTGMVMDAAHALSSLSSVRIAGRMTSQPSDEHLLLGHEVEAARAMRGGVGAGGLALVGAETLSRASSESHHISLIAS